MSETKFTPAPWRISVDPKGFLCIRTGERNEHSDSDLIAEVYCGGGNAHLIASAPTLYEACEAARLAIVNQGGFAEVWPKLEAALAKARGEAA